MKEPKDPGPYKGLNKEDYIVWLEKVKWYLDYELARYHDHHGACVECNPPSGRKINDK